MLARTLDTRLESLQSNENFLAWIDVQASVNEFGDKPLPADPALYGINWILISYAPDIEKNNLFWVLAEVEAGMIPEISSIPWVKNITIIKAGQYERLSDNLKFAAKGIDCAIQRAINEGNKSLQVILYMKNQTIPVQEEFNPPSNNKEIILANVTALIHQLGGEVLKTGSRKNKLLARIPSQSIEEVTKNLYVSEIYLQGPVVFDAETYRETTCEVLLLSSQNDLAIKLSYSIIFASLMDFFTAISKTRRKRLAFYVIAILSATSVLVLLPSVKALDVSTQAIRATDVWDTGNKGAGVTVAIVDSGIDFNHPDFPPQMIRVSWNIPDNNATPANDTDGHGTFVAGCVAGRGILDSSYKGVAWESHLVVVRIVSAFDIDEAIDWVIDNRDAYNITVLNLSWGAPSSPIGEDGMSIYSRVLDDATEAGIVVTKSAGNKGYLGSKSIVTPADAFNIITVGATDDKNTSDISDDTLWKNSSRGPTGDGRPKPDVVAPGVRIMSTKLGGGYEEGDGTSCSAPLVAGAVALMLHANPNLTPAQVKAILRQTARLNNNLTGYGVNDRGHGIIDAYAAVQLAQNVNNINRSQMYDSWNASTRAYGYTYMNFTIDAPNPTFGISLSDIHYYSASEYSLIKRLSAQHVWIDGTYYHLGQDMHKYLFSGPRIYDRQLDAWIAMRAWYQVGNVKIEYLWYISNGVIWQQLWYYGGSDWKALIYIDIDLWDNTNYLQLDYTGEAILIEREFTGGLYFRIRDLNHTESILFLQDPEDNPMIWVLREGYYGNNPEEAKNDQYVYNRDIVLYFQSQIYQNPESNDTIVLITRETEILPPPDPTQNDANTGGDAGNTLGTATYINHGSYTGILCNSDPTDTNDYYKFHAQTGQHIYVSLTPPPDIDFNLQLYDPNGNLKNESNNGAGQTDSILYTADSTGNWTARIYISNGEGQYHFDARTIEPICAMKTRTNGYFYVPSVATDLLKINSTFTVGTGDQTGGTSPYPNILEWPDGIVDMSDLYFVALYCGKTEGEAGFKYMADVEPDRIIDIADVYLVALHFGELTNFNNNPSGVTVKFYNSSGIIEEKSPDSYGFVTIPQGATNFNVTRNGTPIGAMIIFWEP
jgi:serine protease AprX